MNFLVALKINKIKSFDFYFEVRESYNQSNVTAVDISKMISNLLHGLKVDSLFKRID